MIGSSGRKTGYFWMRTESYGQKKKLCGHMKELSWKRSEFPGKMRSPFRKMKKTSRSMKCSSGKRLLVLKEAISPGMPLSTGQKHNFFC